jgi:ABC-2 type transport system permease protein
MNKYLSIFTSGLKNALEYRGALFTWILVELMTLTSAIFIWTAIFRSNSQVGIYDNSSMILYYFLVPMVGSITTVHFSNKLPGKIKDGELSNDLLKPYSPLLAMVANQLAIKTIQNTLKLPIYLLVGFFIFSHFQVTLNPSNVVIGLVVSFAAYILHVTLDLTISLFAFWFDDFWSLSLLKYVMLMIFGGLSFPIDLVPSGWRPVYTFLPFDLIYYFPVSTLMGTLTQPAFQNYVIKIVVWIIVLSLALKLLWQRGVRKYHAYGQ